MEVETQSGGPGPGPLQQKDCRKPGQLGRYSLLLNFCSAIFQCCFTSFFRTLLIHTVYLPSCLSFPFFWGPSAKTASIILRGTEIVGSEYCEPPPESTPVCNLWAPSREPYSSAQSPTLHWDYEIIKFRFTKELCNHHNYL